MKNSVHFNINLFNKSLLGTYLARIYWYREEKPSLIFFYFIQNRE